MDTICQCHLPAIMCWKSTPIAVRSVESLISNLSTITPELCLQTMEVLSFSQGRNSEIRQWLCFRRHLPDTGEQIGDALDRWLVDVAPEPSDNSSLLPLAKRPTRPLTWIRTKDLTVIASFQSSLTAGIHASDSGAIFDGVGNQQLLSAEKAAVICARCMPTFFRRTCCLQTRKSLTPLRRPPVRIVEKGISALEAKSSPEPRIHRDSPMLQGALSAGAFRFKHTLTKLLGRSGCGIGIQTKKSRKLT